jgi:hypothetical protein
MMSMQKMTWKWHENDTKQQIKSGLGRLVHARRQVPREGEGSSYSTDREDCTSVPTKCTMYYCYNDLQCTDYLKLSVYASVWACGHRVPFHSRNTKANHLRLCNASTLDLFKHWSH